MTTPAAPETGRGRRIIGRSVHYSMLELRHFVMPGLD